MSSILTNNGAMVALQTLKSINRDLADTQSQISTGKSVANSRDNAAVWAISKAMESDVKGFQGISDSLNLGESTVAVARQASETVTDLLTQMKGKIVAAQEENVDRAKIQTDIDALRDQIGAVVGAAQFNGLNLLSNASLDEGSGTVSVLSSLDRSDTGVSASSISVGKQDLGTTNADFTTDGTTAVAASTAAQTLNATQSVNLAVVAPTAAGTIYSIGIAATDADSSSFTAADYTTGTTVADAKKIMYISRDGDTAADVAKGLEEAFASYARAQDFDSDVLAVSRSGGTLTLTSSATDASDTLVVRIDQVNNAASTTIGGGLSALNDIDVTADGGAEFALADIESLIDRAIDASASFGSAEGRIETQSDFVQSLTDALKSGIGTLVDADMEEASARLQALQVQQQLGVQALSIANQAPQTLLSLFR